jgi:hypothetical protein
MRSATRNSTTPAVTSTTSVKTCHWASNLAPRKPPASEATAAMTIARSASPRRTPLSSPWVSLVYGPSSLRGPSVTKNRVNISPRPGT